MSTCEDVRLSLGAHMLGALDAEESVLVEAHLATCLECQEELDELVGLPDLLGRVSEEDIEQAASPPRAVLDRLIAASARRRRINRMLLGLAASMTAVIVGGTVWVSVGQSPRQETSAAAAPMVVSSGEAARKGAADSSAAGAAQQDPMVASDQQPSEALMATPAPTPSRSARNEKPLPAPISLTGAKGGVHATLILTPGDKGTIVQVKISGVPDGTRCRVTAVGIDGSESPAGSWKVDAGKYEHGIATFTRRTDLPLDRIARFDIDTSTGKSLLSIEYRR